MTDVLPCTCCHVNKQPCVTTLAVHKEAFFDLSKNTETTSQPVTETHSFSDFCKGAGRGTGRVRDCAVSFQQSLLIYSTVKPKYAELPSFPFLTSASADLTQ